MAKERAVIAGLGQVAPQRRSPHDVETLILRAVRAAIAEAGMAPADIDAMVTESTLCPATASLDRIAVAAGLTKLQRTALSTPVGAGIIAAVGMAADMVGRGEARAVLTWFATGWGSATGGPTSYHAKMEAKHVVEDPAGFTGPPLYFAVAAHRYAHEHGLTPSELEELLFRTVAAARGHGMLHPHAQLRKPLTDLATYRDSPAVADPLRMADCSLLSDGAVALVIARGAAGVVVKAWDYAVDPITDADFYTQSPWLPDLPAARRASAGAFAKAGLTPADIDVLGIYDCFSIAIALQLEALGFCKPGGTLDLVRGGGLRHDGPLPVNTHGGLMSHGYLLGVNHLAEVVVQLRHQAGNRQVAEAERGFVGAGPGRQYAALILERVEA
jgi:acetyl-CoA acetyltransferase